MARESNIRLRPNVVWTPSPNYKRPARPRQISCIVIHATATKGLESPLNWLCDPESKVSAHYIIDKEGMVLQLVDEAHIAWHAGQSTWAGQSNVNNFSIGIELVNCNDERDKYPEEQIKACAELCAGICIDYDIELRDIVGHKEVAPGRKTDPAGFDMGDFKVQVWDMLHDTPWQGPQK